MSLSTSEFADELVEEQVRQIKVSVKDLDEMVVVQQLSIIAAAGWVPQVEDDHLSFHIPSLINTTTIECSGCEVVDGRVKWSIQFPDGAAMDETLDDLFDAGLEVEIGEGVVHLTI